MNRALHRESRKVAKEQAPLLSLTGNWAYCGTSREDL